MKARIKGSDLIVDAVYDEEMIIWKCFIAGKWQYHTEEELDFLGSTDDINWKKVRTDIAMSMIRNTDWQEFCGINFTDTIFNKANELTKKLMEDIK